MFPDESRTLARPAHSPAQNGPHIHSKVQVPVFKKDIKQAEQESLAQIGGAKESLCVCMDGREFGQISAICPFSSKVCTFIRVFLKACFHLMASCPNVSSETVGKPLTNTPSGHRHSGCCCDLFARGGGEETCRQQLRRQDDLDNCFPSRRDLF